MNKTTLVFFGLALIGLFLTGCALKPVKIAAGSDPADEISALHASMEMARGVQVDVLASKNFEIAASYLSQAKEEITQGNDPDDILDSIGYSRAYLELATREATLANSHLKEIIDARREAINAGARELPDQLNTLDEDLKDVSARTNRLSNIKKASLQSNYLALELEAIKFTSMKKFNKL